MHSRECPDLSVFGTGNSPTDIFFFNRQVFFPTKVRVYNIFFQPIFFLLPNYKLFSLFPLQALGRFFPPLPFFGPASEGIPDIPDMSVFRRGNSPTDILFFQPKIIFFVPDDDFFSPFSPPYRP